MVSTSLDISVVICTYTEARWHDLVAAVHSVHGQSVQPREPLVLVPAATAVATLVLSRALARPLGILGPAIASLAMQSAVALVVLPSILALTKPVPLNRT